MLRGGFTNPITKLPELTCDIGMCKLSRPCASYEWKLTFRFDFNNPARSYDPYQYVSLSSFAIDNLVDGTCDLHIQDLGMPSDQPTIFGSMFLQNFIAYFEND